MSTSHIHVKIREPCQNFKILSLPTEGRFPLPRKFYVHTDVNLAGVTDVNKMRSDGTRA